MTTRHYALGHSASTYRWNPVSERWEYFSLVNLSWVPSEAFTDHCENLAPNALCILPFKETWCEPTTR